jgi:hypothetical protein
VIIPARRVQIATPDSPVSHLHATSVLHACANDHTFANDIDLHRFRVGPRGMIAGAERVQLIPRIHEAHSSASRPLSAAFTTASANALLSVGCCAPARAPGRSHRLIAAAMALPWSRMIRSACPDPLRSALTHPPCDDAGSELDLPMCLIRS